MAAPIGRRQALQIVLAAVPLAALARAGEASAEVPLPVPAAPALADPAAAVLGAEAEPRPAEASAGHASKEAAPAQAALPELVPGLRIGSCTVVRVGEALAGGVPVLLQARDGTQFGVDILRHERLTPGVARGGRLAVYLNNGGTGFTASNEAHGLGAMALGRWLARRESRGCSVPALLTLRQRTPLLAALQA